MKILIIGCNGFIGSHLANYFISNNTKVIGCDIHKSTSLHVPYSQINNIDPDFNQLFLNESFDFCINASGSASVPYSIQNPAEDFRLNVTNVNLILHAIRNHNNTCGFLNFSSAAVYGNPIQLPIDESMTSAPLSPYGFHKLISEQICSEFYKLYNIKTLSLRVFSAYGPGLQKQLFWDIYNKLKNNKKELILYGSGNESRDFIYIEDLCIAVETLINSANLNGDAINIASGEELKIKDAAKLFIKALNISIEPQFSGEQKKGDPLNWRADISKLNSLGYKPRYNFEKGIHLSGKWLLEN